MAQPGDHNLPPAPVGGLAALTRSRAIALAVIALAAAAVYLPALNAPIQLDDQGYVLEHLDGGASWNRLREMLVAPGGGLAHRAVMRLSFAADSWLWGGWLPGYHLTNLLIHIACAAALYVLLRRVGRRWLGRRSAGFALAAVLLWAVHPLTTQAVSYLVQRGEALASLFYVVGLYAVVRVARGRGVGAGAGWAALAWAAAVLGLMSKEIALTLPIAALLVDGLACSRRWSQPIRQRWWLYLLLATCWGVLAWTGTLGSILGGGAPAATAPAAGSAEALPSAGLAMEGVTPAAYLRTQAGVILHYLKLVVYPAQLIFDYRWPIASGWWPAALPFAVVGSLAAASLAGLALRRWWGLAGALFFVLLGPTSSVVPIADAAVEHRMYLALACVLVLILGAGRALLIRLPRPRGLQPTAAVLVLAAAAALGARTYARNLDYLHALPLWEQSVAWNPDNARAWHNLGHLRYERGQTRRALAAFKRAIELNPNHPHALAGAGAALTDLGQADRAVALLERAAGRRDHWLIHYNLAQALRAAGAHERALAAFARAAEAGDADAANNYANQLRMMGRLDQARAAYELALRRNPQHTQAMVNLGGLLVQQGQPEPAQAILQRAVRLQPGFSEAHNQLGIALAQTGQLRQAAAHFEAAVAADPQNQQAIDNLQRARGMLGR